MRSSRRPGGRVRPALAAGLLAALLAAAGCDSGPRSETFPVWNQSRPERLALFADVEKLAVAPFRDPAGSPGLDPEHFALLAADELVGLKRFKVIYPAQVAARAEEANREAEERARVEKRAAGPDELIDLERSESDAVAAGRAAGADAVLVATVHDFEVYPPKRLAVTFRVYLCSAPRKSFAEILRMTEAGVPVEVPGALRERYVWERQAHYDAGSRGTRGEIGDRARGLESARGLGTEVFYASTEKFLTFAAGEAAAGLYADSLWHRSKAGRELQRAQGIAPLPGTRPGSGYGPGEDDRGLEKTPAGRGGDAPGVEAPRGDRGLPPR